MLYLLHTHGLLFFGALALGIVIGWLTYLRAATRWTDRPVHIAMGAVAIGAIVAMAKVVPGRYGYWLELGLVLAVFYTIGCFIGWALRDLASSVPAAAKPAAAGSAASTGSYLFQDAFAGLGAGNVYMRTLTADGGIARERLALSTGALTKAPAAGGYTFPKTLPFADATTGRRAEPMTGMRRHWSWPRPTGAVPARAVDDTPVPQFASSKGGYVYPMAAKDVVSARARRGGTTRAGQLKHWTWRANEGATGPAPVSTTTHGVTDQAGVGLRDTPVVPEPTGPASMDAIETPSDADRNN